MQINSTTNLMQIKFDTSQALYIENNNIKEENVKPHRIIFIPGEDIDNEKCVGKDGKSFDVVSYYKVDGENLDKDYIDVFSYKAQEKDVKCYDYYVNNFVAKITKNFSDSTSLKNDKESLKKGIENLITEMKENTSKGISNDIENLNTKFNVNGVDFTFKELMNSSKVMEYSNSILVNVGSGLDYENYAEMGIAKGKISTYAEKNLNVYQQKLLNDTMSARIENIINSVPEKVDETFKKSIVIDNNNEFYSMKNIQGATNIEYARKIMNTFANVDYSNTESFEKAINEYRTLIKPVLESAGIKNIGRNQSLTDTTNYNIKRFKSLFDESYKRVFLSAAEVRKKFGNSKNVIDIYR
ncbi:hypothetical protein [Clostridium weizhouense]|uniref:Uncharacterized protein n=1 Tax=Clostridium weizhouense TaxID=2859781 RepID=A0ABS7ASG0_9CLOT|nr:hypothetical protein [Clostridium weizhouense]MBW6411591.1 hypothetical protein [Clostridium weizhouense]